MNPLATWEKVLLGVLAVIVLLWWFPGAKALMRRSRDAEPDWRAVILPMLAVALFVVFLIYLVRN